MPHPVSCPSCGFLQEEANFCRECGASLRFAEAQPPTAPEPVPYPWRLLAAFLIGLLVIAGILGQFSPRPEIVQGGMFGVVVASATWVWLDATRRKVPRPWVWLLTVWFFWLVCFPWYLARRRWPDRPCLLDSPRNPWELSMVLITGAVLTFFLLALARFLTRQAGP